MSLPPGRREHFRLLCPNCHAQTETDRGRNIGGAGRRETESVVGPALVPDPPAA